MKKIIIILSVFFCVSAIYSQTFKEFFAQIKKSFHKRGLCPRAAGLCAGACKERPNEKRQVLWSSLRRRGKSNQHFGEVERDKYRSPTLFLGPTRIYRY